MNRAIVSLLALLLVLSLTVAPSMADSGTTSSSLSETPFQNQVSTAAQAESSIQTIPNTTNRLSLEGDTRDEYTDYGADLGATIASTDDELRIDHGQYATIDRAFDDASPEERRTLLRNAYDRLTAQSTELEAREQRAVQAHANGTLSSDQLLRTLLRNHREAAVLSESLGDLEARADRVPGFSLSVSDEQDKLEMHRTTVRSQLGITADGYNSGDTIDMITVETSANGFVVSTLGESYVREAVRFDNRDTSRETQFDDILDAYDHSRDLYPWAYETVQSPSFNEHTTVQLYLIDNNHDQGHLKAYLDGGTGTIYREVQELNERSLPTTQSNWINNELELTVNDTAANGPAKVMVTDRKTGEPERATITVNGVEIGETNADGSRWYLPPRDRYELEATTATGSSINATVLGS